MVEAYKEYIKSLEELNARLFKVIDSQNETIKKYQDIVETYKGMLDERH